MTDASKVTVTLNEKGKYLEIEELYALSYSNERKDFDSDITFANFRAVKGGKLKPDTFFRSASPCDDRLNRAAYATSLPKKPGSGSSSIFPTVRTLIVNSPHSRASSRRIMTDCIKLETSCCWV